MYWSWGWLCPTEYNTQWFTHPCAFYDRFAGNSLDATWVGYGSSLLEMSTKS